MGASRITPIPRVSPVSRASGVKNWLFYRFPGRPPGTASQRPLSSVPAPSWDQKAFFLSIYPSAAFSTLLLRPTYAVKSPGPFRPFFSPFQALFPGRPPGRASESFWFTYWVSHSPPLPSQLAFPVCRALSAFSVQNCHLILWSSFLSSILTLNSFFRPSPPSDTLILASTRPGLKFGILC